jgi:hypothetical protein
MLDLLFSSKIFFRLYFIIKTLYILVIFIGDLILFHVLCKTSVRLFFFFLLCNYWTRKKKIRKLELITRL